MRVISSQFFSGTKEMTRARIMRVKSRQKRVNQIRASFVKDARRQMRVDTRSLAGAVKRALQAVETRYIQNPGYGTENPMKWDSQTARRLHGNTP